MERFNLQGPDDNLPAAEERRRMGHAEHRVQMQYHFIQLDPDDRLKRLFGSDGTNAQMGPPLQTTKPSQHVSGTHHATIPPPICSGHGLCDPNWYGGNEETFQTAHICRAIAHGRIGSRT